MAAPPPDLPDLVNLVRPPDGVKLLSATRSKTGEGGQGVIGRYSDGTTVSAMVNSDGSVTVLLFRGSDAIPAVPAGDAMVPCRFTWRRA
jgi:hypothetical protein